MTEAPPPKKAGKQPASVAKQTRNNILKSALVCFANKGFKSTTLREIAEEAHTTHGLVRHYFGTKDKLWEECVSSALKQATRLQRPAMSNITDENALEAFKTVIRVLIQHSAKNPELWKLLIFEALKNSEKLNHIFDIILPVHRRIDPLFKKVQELGYLTEYTNDELFLILISLGAFPFAVSSLSNKLLQKNLHSKTNLRKHEDLIIGLLFSD